MQANKSSRAARTGNDGRVRYTARVRKLRIAAQFSGVLDIEYGGEIAVLQTYLPVGVGVVVLIFQYRDGMIWLPR